MTLVAVREGESFTPDEGDTVLGAANLGNGYTVYASGPVYPYVVPQTINDGRRIPCQLTHGQWPLSLSSLRPANRYNV